MKSLLCFKIWIHFSFVIAFFSAAVVVILEVEIFIQIKVGQIRGKKEPKFLKHC